MQEVSADDAQRHGVAVDDELTTDTSETKTSTTSSDQTASTKTLGVLSESPEIDKQGTPLFDISISEPEKHGEGMSAYVTYTIKTKTKSGLLKSPQLEVDRRYNDFDWLHLKLSQQYKGVIIPPLPEKAIINRFSPEFIEYRRKELERFLRRVAAHPILQRSELLKAFLELSDSEFAQYKEGSKKEKKGLMGSLSDKIGVNVTIRGTPVEVDQWYTAQKSYVQMLDNNLQTLLKRSSTIVNKQKEMAQLWNDFSSVAKSLCSTEKDADPILSKCWEKLAETTQQIAPLHSELSEIQVQKFDDSLKDYIRILDAVRELLSNRSQVLYNLQSASKYVEQKKEKHSNKPNDTKLQKEYEEAVKKEEEAKKEYEEINTSCRNELDQFRLSKQRELLAMLADLAQTYMNHELRVVHLWKELLEFLQDSKQQLESSQTKNNTNL